MPVVTVVVVILAILGLALVLMYNALVRWRLRVRNSWSQIDVQLKRRYDLIPNLVETAKGYMKHEREVLENVTRARAACMSSQGPAKQAEAENFLSQTLKSLFAVVENYPDLKANQNMMALQEELASTENRIAFARQFYNDTVMRYNTEIQSVPTNVIAGIFRFQPAELFETTVAEERVAPKVTF